MEGRINEVEKVVTDEQLMAQTAKGDDGAFHELVKRHQNAVYGTVLKMVGQQYQADAEDVAQQVFIKVYQAADRYQPTAKFTTWLMTICRNCVFTYLKKAKSRPVDRLMFDPEKEEGLDIKDDRVMLANELIEQKETQRAIDQAFMELPENQRMAMILQHYHQMDYEQIAKVLKTSVSSVKSLLFRARETLKEKLSVFLGATFS